MLLNMSLLRSTVKLMLVSMLRGETTMCTMQKKQRLVPAGSSHGRG